MQLPTRVPTQPCAEFMPMRSICLLASTFCDVGELVYIDTGLRCVHEGVFVQQGRSRHGASFRCYGPCVQTVTRSCQLCGSSDECCGELHTQCCTRTAGCIRCRRTHPGDSPCSICSTSRYMIDLAVVYYQGAVIMQDGSDELKDFLLSSLSPLIAGIALGVCVLVGYFMFVLVSCCCKCCSSKRGWYALGKACTWCCLCVLLFFHSEQE